MKKKVSGLENSYALDKLADYQGGPLDLEAHKKTAVGLLKAHDELEEKVRERTLQLHKLNKKLRDTVKEQQRIEKALRASENYYRTIFENTGTATVIADKDLKITAANLKAEQLTGYKSEELIGLNPFEHFLKPEYLPLVHKNFALRKIDAASAPPEYEIECINRNGEIRNIILNVGMVPESENMVASLRDITEQHHDQIQLERSEERFRTLFEQAPLGIGINREGRTLFVNQAYIKMFGYKSSNDLIDTMVTDQVAPACRQAIADKIRQRSQGEEVSTSHETWGQHRDGSIFPVLVHVDKIILADGPANVAFFTDISAQKEAEADLQHLVDAQNLLLEISRHFANIVTFNMDAMVNLTLQRIGEFDQSDRSYIFLFSNNDSVMTNTHEWCATGIAPAISTLQDLPASEFPWWMSKLHRRENIFIPRVDDLPIEAQAEKKILEAQNIKSLCIVPMVSDDRLIGFMGLDSVASERNWSETNIVILESVAQIIAKGLQRRSYAEDLAASENYYRTLFANTGAATMIIEEDLTISMVNEQCGKLLNCSRQDLIGKKLSEFCPADQLILMRDYQQGILQGPEKGPERYDIQMIDNNGRSKDGLLQVDFIPGTNKMVATFIDMSEFKRVDRALKAISAINAAMVHAEKEEDLLALVCQKIVEIGGYCLAWVGYLLDTPDQKVKAVAEAGRNHGYTHKLNISLQDPKRGNGPAGIAIRSCKPMVCRNIKTDPNFKPWAKDALRREYKSCMAIPLIDNNKAFGVLSIYSNELGVFNREEEKLLIEMANNLAFAINSLRARQNIRQTTADLEMSLEKMQRLLLQSVSALGTAIDIRDPYTAGHQRRVVRLATAIAVEMGFTQQQIEGIAVAGNLHDLGKINVPSEILSKPGRLSEIEFAHIKTHPQAGYEIIKDIEFPWPVADVLLQHHERINGSGYPQGLVGTEILLEARIMAVADVVEAMASHRPYRPALGIEAALDEIEQNKGILYDVDVADACLKLFREDGFQL